MYFRTLYTTSVINRHSQLTSSKPVGRHEELITFINLCMNTMNTMNNQLTKLQLINKATSYKSTTHNNIILNINNIIHIDYK